MRVRKPALSVFAAVAITLVAAADAHGASDGGAKVGTIALSATPHPGAEAIDVSGTGPIGRPLTITLVSTFSRDLPDVVLSRTTVVPDAAGAFSATISIAPGFTRGSVITVTATPFNGGPAARVYYRPDWPNHSVPLDEQPRSIR